ncbi:MAG: hypothetical protein GPJ52_07755 [Candidatus Heimdallarchaeota archaeon]|nr:hypothetical protein [Candidatus Heimdallarchaeota archaeon]
MRKTKILFLLFCVVLISTTSVKSRPPLQFDCEGYIKDAGTSVGINGAAVRLWVYDFITGWQYEGLIYTYSHPVTHEPGYYIFSDIPMGAKQIRVSESGYHTYYGVHQATIYLETFTYDYIFYGSISDAETTQLLSDATVRINDGTREISDTTDNSGYYCIVFSYSTGGERSFDMVVSKDGYNTEEYHILMSTGYEHKNVALEIDTGTEYYAVLVGISYDTASQLCDNSILLWYEFLTNNKMAFKEENIKVYGTDEPGNVYPDGKLGATLGNVNSGLQWMSNIADYNDVIVFIYSGHGGTNGNGGSYLELWGQDANLYDTTLANYLKNSAAERIFCSIDCCYAGGFGPDIRDNTLNGEKTFTVTSADADTPARGVDIDTWEWTVWTKKFLHDAWMIKPDQDTYHLEDLFVEAYNAMNNDPNIDYLPEVYDGNPSENEDFSIR